MSYTFFKSRLNNILNYGLGIKVKAVNWGWHRIAEENNLVLTRSVGGTVFYRITELLFANCPSFSCAENLLAPDINCVCTMFPQLTGEELHF